MVVSANDLEADRKSVNLTGRYRDGGDTREVRRNRQRAVIANRAVEAKLFHEVDTFNRGSHWAFGCERYIGVGGAEDEINLIEDFGHLKVHVGPE